MHATAMEFPSDFCLEVSLDVDPLKGTEVYPFGNPCIFSHSDGVSPRTTVVEPAVMQAPWL